MVEFPSQQHPHSLPDASERFPYKEQQEREFSQQLEARMQVAKEPFPFQRLPPELQHNVLQQAAMFPDRGEANTTIQNFRQASHVSNDLIMRTPLRHEAQTLQAYPGMHNRADAAWQDFTGGESPLDALAQHHVTDQAEIDDLKLAGATDDVEGGGTSADAIKTHKITNKDHIKELEKMIPEHN